MSNNSDSSSSSSKSGCFRNLTTLVTALGGGAGIVALLTFVMTRCEQPSLNHKGERTIQPQPTHTVPENEPQPSKLSNININWGNLSQYFDITRDKLKPGFQQANSELSFVIEAKGDFSGRIIVYFSDAEKVKICPHLIDCSILGYGGFVYLTTKNSSGYTFWQKRETDRAIVSVPNNTVEIRFEFEQYH